MTMTSREILALPMAANDADAATVRGYLIALLAEMWEKEERFSGKRPFGNSGWQGDVHLALVKAGAIEGTLDPDGYLEDYDDDGCNALILAAIRELGAA